MLQYILHKRGTLFTFLCTERRSKESANQNNLTTRMNCVGLFCVLAVVIAGTLASDSTEWHFVTTSLNGVRSTGVLGLNRRSMIMIPDDVHRRKRCTKKRTINLHDFEQGMVAMKDPVKRSCWVKPLGKRETYELTKKFLASGKDMIQNDENWIIPRNPLKKTVVEREIGNMLTEFCSDSDVYMLKRKLNNSIREAKKKRKWCIVCFGCSLVGQKEASSAGQ